jgi:hypothetical protein
VQAFCGARETRGLGDRHEVPKMTQLHTFFLFNSVVVQSARGHNAIAVNYTATLAVIDSHAKKVAESAAASFLRPGSPRFATGIDLIHPYDPNKIPILFVQGLISSPLTWQNLINDLCSDPEILVG